MLTGLASSIVPDSWRHPSLKRNVIMNWVTTATNVALSFVLIPVIVRTLDKELYGVWSFLNGLGAYSNLIYMGLGAAFLKYFSEARGRDDHASLTRLLGVACTLYLGLGSICLLVSLAISPWVPHLFARPLSPQANWAAEITTVLIGLRILLFFVASAFSALLAAHGRMDLVSVTSTVGACLRTAAAALAMRLPNPLVALAIVSLMEAVWQLGTMALLGRLVAPAVRIAPARPTSTELRGLYGFGFQAFFVQLAVVLIGYTDTALIGVFLGAASITPYALPLQLVEYSRILVNGVTLSLLPELSAAKARGDSARLKEVYLRAGRVCAALAAFINVHLVILGPGFLGLWIGPSFLEGSRTILLFLAMSATASALSNQLLGPFFQALDVLKVLVVITLAEAGLNVLLSIWLSQTIGLSGVALATALPACLVTLLLAPRYILPLLGVTLRDFLRSVLAPAFALGAASVGLQALLSLRLGFDSYAILVARVVCSSLLAVPIVLATFPKEEWRPLVARWVR